MPDPVEGKRIEPTLLLGIAESLVVNPFKETMGQKFWPTRSRPILKKTWTELLKSRQKR